MLIYDTHAEAERAEGIITASPQKPSESRWDESDWGERLRGRGQPGGYHGGWLLTFLYDREAALENENQLGTLIAYEVVEEHRTGRVAVLRRDWPLSINDEQENEIRDCPEWDTDARATYGEADIDWVDVWVSGQQL